MATKEERLKLIFEGDSSSMEGAHRKVSAGFENMVEGERKVKRALSELTKDFIEAKNGGDVLAASMFRLSETFKVGGAAAISVAVAYAGFQKMREIAKQLTDENDKLYDSYVKLSTASAFSTSATGGSGIGSQIEQRHAAMDAIKKQLDEMDGNGWNDPLSLFKKGMARFGMAVQTGDYNASFQAESTLRQQAALYGKMEAKDKGKFVGALRDELSVQQKVNEGDSLGAKLLQIKLDRMRELAEMGKVLGHENSDPIINRKFDAQKEAAEYDAKIQRQNVAVAISIARLRGSADDEQEQSLRLQLNLARQIEMEARRAGMSAEKINELAKNTAEKEKASRDFTRARLGRDIDTAGGVDQSAMRADAAAARAGAYANPEAQTRIELDAQERILENQLEKIREKRNLDQTNKQLAAEERQILDQISMVESQRWETAQKIAMAREKEIREIQTENSALKLQMAGYGYLAELAKMHADAQERIRDAMHVGNTDLAQQIALQEQLNAKKLWEEHFHHARTQTQVNRQLRIDRIVARQRERENRMYDRSGGWAAVPGAAAIIGSTNSTTADIYRMNRNDTEKLKRENSATTHTAAIQRVLEDSNKALSEANNYLKTIAEKEGVE